VGLHSEGGGSFTAETCKIEKQKSYFGRRGRGERKNGGIAFYWRCGREEHASGARRPLDWRLKDPRRRVSKSFRFHPRTSLGEIQKRRERKTMEEEKRYRKK